MHHLEWCADMSCAALPCVFLTLDPPVVQVARVHYPGLPSHPHHARIQGVYAGCGGVLAVELKGGVVAAEAMMAVSCWCLCTGCRVGSWGCKGGRGLGDRRASAMAGHPRLLSACGP
jgi:hypothetical protein